MAIGNNRFIYPSSATREIRNTEIESYTKDGLYPVRVPSVIDDEIPCFAIYDGAGNRLGWITTPNEDGFAFTHLYTAYLKREQERDELTWEGWKIHLHQDGMYETSFRYEITYGDRSLIGVGFPTMPAAYKAAKGRVEAEIAKKQEPSTHKRAYDLACSVADEFIGLGDWEGDPVPYLRGLLSKLRGEVAHEHGRAEEYRAKLDRTRLDASNARDEARLDAMGHVAKVLGGWAGEASAKNDPRLSTEIRDHFNTLWPGLGDPERIYWDAYSDARREAAREK